MAPDSRLASCSVRSKHNRCQAFVNLVAGPGMGYGAYVAPFLLHCDATAMRAACVQMCHAIERVPVWPTPAALRTLELSYNPIGDAGASALAASLRVRQRRARLVVFDARCVLVCVRACLIRSRSMRIDLVFS